MGFGARCLLIGSLLALAGLSLGAGPAQAERFSVRTLHFDVLVGPRDSEHCDVVADLYRPRSAKPRDPAPAIMTTNGFGGSKDGQRGIAEVAARRGYVVLAYSGLGFGGSGCRITLDHPQWDGKAASQLIDFLGGGKEAKDGTRIRYVSRDRGRAADGRRYRVDPRVGMIGGSYGGQVQFAAAAVDPRLDAITPLVTWNDLTYSLTPNNTDFRGGVTSATPGAPKWLWSAFFFALGEARGLEFLGEDVARIGGGCPNFHPRVCPAFVQGAAINHLSPPEIRALRGASVASYVERVRIPTLIGQGQTDTLFNLNESVATYRALRRQGTPVRLLWQSGGHSGPSAPGDYDGGDPGGTFLFEEIMSWLRFYLKDRGPKPPEDFCYFRDWVDYGDPGNAGRAYRCNRSYPAARRAGSVFLSGGGSLAPRRRAAAAGSASFLAPPEVPTSHTEVSAVDPGLPLFDVPGTFASYTSPPLRRGISVAGIPKLRARVSSPLQDVTRIAGPAGMTTLFVKLLDIGPGGGETLPEKLISPIRIPVTDEEVEIELPGIVHRFERGHRLRLVIAGSDLAYRGNAAPHLVTVRSGPEAELELPVVSRARRPAFGG